MFQVAEPLKTSTNAKVLKSSVKGVTPNSALNVGVVAFSAHNSSCKPMSHSNGRRQHSVIRSKRAKKY